jgi:tRNA A37 threonylcarbamoyladenosine dehydratase
MVCADVFETRDDPLCRIMRRELRRMDIKAHRVVAVPGAADAALRPPGSMAFVPGVMGLTLAQEAVRMIVEGGEGDEGDRTCR